MENEKWMEDDNIKILTFVRYVYRVLLAIYVLSQATLFALNGFGVVPMEWYIMLIPTWTFAAIDVLFGIAFIAFLLAFVCSTLYADRISQNILDAFEVKITSAIKNNTEGEE